MERYASEQASLRTEVPASQRSGTPPHAVRTKLLAALVSSWLVSPLAIGFAQLVGFANAPAVLVTLLTVGAIAPLQVLINEALVPVVVVKGRRLSTGSEAVIALLQAATVGAVFLYSAAPNIGAADKVLAVIAGVLSSHFSTKAASLQLRMILEGRLRHRVVILVAATPGLLMLLVFVMTGTLRQLGPETGFRSVYASLALPAAVQCLILRAGSNARRAASGETHIRPVAAISGWFLIAVVVFIGASSAATALRAEMGALHERFAGLLLVALNATFSLSFTVSKILFLEGNGPGKLTLLRAVVVLGTLTLISMVVVRHGRVNFPVMFAALVVVQSAMTVTISAVRRHLHGGV